MRNYEHWVIQLHKASAKKPRLKSSEYVILPTEDCPLPDQTPDMSDEEWLMLCYLVHSKLNPQAES